MKVIEQTDERVWISSEAELWQKIICWCFSIATLYFLWGEGAVNYSIAIVGSLFWFLVTTSVAETIFDIEHNTIYGKYRIGGVNLRNIEVPLDTSKLLSMMGQHNPNLYLVIASGKKYRIGDFFSGDGLDSFISNAMGNVHIDHDRKF